MIRWTKSPSDSDAYRYVSLINQVFEFTYLEMKAKSLAYDFYKQKYIK